MMTGAEADLRAVTDSGTRSGVEHGAELLAFTDGLVTGSDATLQAARAKLVSVAGPAPLVDAAAVASNFERMVRIADASGIPLDAPLEAASGEMRAELGLDRFAAGHAV